MGGAKEAITAADTFMHAVIASETKILLHGAILSISDERQHFELRHICRACMALLCVYVLRDHVTSLMSSFQR